MAAAEPWLAVPSTAWSTSAVPTLVWLQSEMFARWPGELHGCTADVTPSVLPAAMFSALHVVPDFAALVHHDDDHVTATYSRWLAPMAAGVLAGGGQPG